MKKVLVSLFVFGILISNTNASVLVDEGFENYQAGNYPNPWSVRFSGSSQCVSDSVAKTGNNSLRLQAAPYSAAESLLYLNAPENQVWELSFSLYCDSSSTTLNTEPAFPPDVTVAYDNSSLGLSMGLHLTTNGQLVVHKAGEDSTATVNFDQWNNFRIVINPVTEVANYYLNDVILFADRGLTSPTLGRLNNLSVHVGSINNGNLIGYFDDIKIQTIPEPATITLLSLGGLMLRKRK